MIGERVERASRCERRVPQAAAGVDGRVGRGHRGTGSEDRACHSAERRGEQRLEAFTQGFGEARRRAAGADRDDYRRAVDDRGDGKIAQRRTVDDVDEQAVATQPGRLGLGRSRIIERDEG
jgi:hypothetical protein